MNWYDIHGNWPVIKETVAQKWSKLSESEIETIRGDKDRFKHLLMERYGLDKDAAEAQVEEWRDSLSR